jgi:hypothetical protein
MLSRQVAPVDCVPSFVTIASVLEARVKLYELYPAMVGAWPVLFLEFFSISLRSIISNTADESFVSEAVRGCGTQEDFSVLHRRAGLSISIQSGSSPLLFRHIWPLASLYPCLHSYYIPKY